MDYRADQRSAEEIKSKGYSSEDARRQLKIYNGNVNEALRALERSKYRNGDPCTFELNDRGVRGKVVGIKDFGLRIVRSDNVYSDQKYEITCADLDACWQKYNARNRDQGSRDRGSSQGHRDRNDRDRRNAHGAPPRYSDAPTRESMRKEKKVQHLTP